MRNVLALTVVVVWVLVSSCTARAQAGAAADNNLYNQLRNVGPGGPAPSHDIAGLWTGNIEAKKGEVPPLTPLGQRLFSLNKSQAKFGEAASNDPWKTCDPFGFPRSAVDQIRFMAFAQMPGRIVVLQSYERTAIDDKK